jgi:hypothetical protein
MSNKVFGGGYTCSNCGKYHRTTTVCNCGDRKKLPEKKVEKIPTAEEFIQGYDMNFKDGKSPLIHMLKEFAKLHVQAALQSASEQARATTRSNGEWISSNTDASVNKSSILNAYPLTNIV